jgi:hypothetical protein
LKEDSGKIAEELWSYNQAWSCHVDRLETERMDLEDLLNIANKNISILQRQPSTRQISQLGKAGTECLNPRMDECCNFESDINEVNISALALVGIQVTATKHVQSGEEDGSLSYAYSGSPFPAALGQRSHKLVTLRRKKKHL